MFPFLTQPEDHPEAQTPSLTRTLRELREEKVDLESQEVELRQQLADTKTHQCAQTGFAPLSSIFPLRRDAFGQTKSARQQLNIYRKEWSSVQDRFNRVSDTGYTSELIELIDKKQAKVKALEHAQLELKANIQTLERKVQKMRSDSANDSMVASMTDLASHVCLLREQVKTLEVSEEQSAQMFQEAGENLRNAKNRYRKMKTVAKECGISMRRSMLHTVQSEYIATKLHLKRLENRSFFKEEQRVRELTEEKRRLNALEKQLKLAVATKEAETSAHHFEKPSHSARISPSLPQKHMNKDRSLLLTQRARY